MFDNRDFTVCKNCGERCYMGNDYCEDCANELFEAECGINSDYAKILEDNEVLKKALELACENLQDINFKLYNNEVDFVNYFKEKAKQRR